ncbi:MAG: autotransporter assembly complex protein TamA [marine benthic group bacterium]|nr:autotransporter assembly complex protein TamA [Gemmatimonadota bacterium]
MFDVVRSRTVPAWVSALALLFALLVPGVATGQERQEAEPTVKVSVEIEGLEGELADNAEAVLGLKLQEGNELTPARARALHRRAPEELQLALSPFGRYDVTVQGDLVSEGSDWTARYTVDPGEPTRIERVDVVVTGEGAADSVFAAITDSLPFAPGDTLRHAPYETIKAQLQRQASNHGYFEAAFDTAQIRVDRPRHAAEVVLHFDTGPRYRFGPITVEQDVLDPRYVDGYVTARQGEPFDAALLRQAQVDLTTGPWFGRADIKLDTEEAGENLEVPVQFELTPARPQRYEVAVGYGTDTGFRGTLGAKFRRINRNAHNAEAELRVSQIETSVAGRYNIPRPFPSTSVYSLFGSYGDVSPTWSSTRVGRVGASWSHMRGPFRETVSLAWEQSSYETAVDTGKATLIGPEIAWTWVETNDRIVATKGHRLNLKLGGALDGVLSTASYLNANLDAKLIRSVGRRVRAIARGQVGYIVTDEIRDLPPTRRYVTGGDQTVRGYAFESLGPALPGETEEGDPLLIGGKALLLASAEADYEVIPSWRLAVFGDAGNALADFSDIELEYGVGAGIRWVSPIGMIRFDGAFAVSEPGTPFRVHFIIGPDL